MNIVWRHLENQMLPYNSWIIQIDMFTMDMCNGHFNNRFIDLQMLGHFEFLPFLPKNGRVESISIVHRKSTQKW